MADRDSNSYVQDRIFKYTDVTIANGQTESEAIDIVGGVPVGYLAPAVMTGTSFTFKVSDDGVTFSEYYNTDGNQITASVNAGKRTGLIPYDFEGCQFIKLVSSSAESAERLIKVYLRGA